MLDIATNLVTPLERHCALFYRVPNHLTVEKQYGKGSNIYTPGDSFSDRGIHYILSGSVETCIQQGNGEAGIATLEEEDSFGYEWLVPRRELEMELTAKCLTNVTTRYCETSVFEKMCLKDAEFALALAKTIIFYTFQLQQHIADFALLKIRPRVAAFLLEKARRSGRVDAGDHIVIRGYTHETISHYVGTSREIVTFHLNSFRHLGLIRYSRKGIEIWNMDGLRQIVDDNKGS